VTVDGTLAGDAAVTIVCHTTGLPELVAICGFEHIDERDACAGDCPP
jgi:hypothetical protein